MVILCVFSLDYRNSRVAVQLSPSSSAWG